MSPYKFGFFPKMRCHHLRITMDDFVLLHTIEPSSYRVLRNNLSLQIYDTFITWCRGMPTSSDSNRSTIWVMVIYIQV